MTVGAEAAAESTLEAMAEGASAGMKVESEGTPSWVRSSAPLAGGVMGETEEPKRETTDRFHHRPLRTGPTQGEFRTFTQVGVWKALRPLGPKEAPGPDGLAVELFQGLPSVLCADRKTF